jgi:ataxia telangiectasia mutated family protein
VTQSEKAAYAKPSKVARSLASARLSACAGTVRLAVEVGVQTLRQKTVKALIDHITQIIPSSDDNYCEPLLKDYARALTTTLAYRPHVEHLSKDDWHVLVDFCIAGIHASSTHDDVEGGSHALANGSSRLVTRNSRPGTQSPFTVSFSHNNDSGPRGSMNAGSSKTVDEFSLCLYYLFSTPNAPLLDKASSATPVLLALLRAPSTGGAHHAAFRSINAVISRSITEDQGLAQQTFRDILQPLRRLWHTKSPLLKEEMLTSMIKGEALLNSILQVDDDEDCRTDLQGLFDVMSVEYCKRLPRDQLQLDDLRFNYESHGEDGHDTFETKTLGLRYGGVKSEQPWAILNILTSIFATLGDPLSFSSLPGDDDSSISRKRRKLSSTIDTLLQPLSTGSNQDKLFTLQMLVFLMGKLVWDEETMLKVLDAVTPILSIDSSEIAALAMLVLAS